jgi:hypothetical protein
LPFANAAAGHEELVADEVERATREDVVGREEGEVAVDDAARVVDVGDVAVAGVDVDGRIDACDQVAGDVDSRSP